MVKNRRRPDAQSNASDSAGMVDVGGRTPPGPDGLPMLGSALDFVRAPRQFLEGLTEHGDVAQYSIGGVDTAAVFHPEFIEDVLVTRQSDYDVWNIEDLQQSLGFEVAPEGIVSVNGKQWKQQRRLLQPVFSLSHIQSHGETMVEHTERMIDDWNDGDVIDLDEEFAHLSLGILTDSVFDVDIESDSQAEIVFRMMDILRDLEIGGLSTISTAMPAWVPIPANRRWKQTMSEFGELATEMIERRRGNLDEYDDLLTHMLSAETEDGYSLSDAELRDQLKDFFLAGYETTATTLNFTAHLYSSHPSVRQKLEDEIDSVLGGSAPTLSDLDDLVYTEKVVRESLRRYPPGAAIFREATQDTRLGEYHISEGTRVALPQFIVQNDERFFDDPETFRPERWSDEMEVDAPNFAYFPFGGGPRICIGMRFAMMELTYILSIMAQKYRLEPVYGDELDIDLHLPLGIFQPSHPLRMRVHER